MWHFGARPFCICQAYTQTQISHCTNQAPNVTGTCTFQNIKPSARDEEEEEEGEEEGEEEEKEEEEVEERNTLLNGVLNS
jgi:hypothetical protein